MRGESPWEMFVDYLLEDLQGQGRVVDVAEISSRMRDW